MKIILDKTKWHSKEEISVRGCCWDIDGNLLEKETLIDRLLEYKTAGEIFDFFRKLNGLYGVIINKPNMQILSVDKTRIYPLYYRKEGQEIIVSDLPQNIIKDEDVISKNSREEYLSIGAPLQGKTLIKNIYQVKPAHAIIIQDGLIKEEEIYSLAVCKSEIRSSSLNLEKKILRHIFDNIFDRLVESLKNRQVVIPLSGGYDSRLIISMLVKRDYHNIVCYTIGPNLPYEQNIAEETAKRLGVRLYHIDYRNAKYITQEFGSEEFYSMVDYVGAYGNFLWLFEYNAIKWLKGEGILKDDAVFIPGHCGDFIGGSHLAKIGIRKNDSGNIAAIKLILNSFEYYRPFRNKHLKKEVKQYISDGLKDGKLCYSVIMNFILKNRLAHQINNSSRVYDFMNYDVRLPLWDNELTEFFRKAEYIMLYNKKLYDEVVCDVFREMNLTFKIKGKKERIFWKQYFINWIKQYSSRDLYLRHKGAIDKLGEKELTKEMVKELVANKIMKDEEDYLSENEIMLKWYLLRVETERCKKK